MTDKGKPLNLIDLLLDINQSFPPEYLHIFSDITEADLAEMKNIWPRMPILRKINLLQDLEAMMESDTLLSCDDFALFALKDEDANVRTRAINLLWESEDPRLVRLFGEILVNDPIEAVRAEAASALGRFVLMGELEEISQRKYDHIVDLLMQQYASEVFDEVRLEIMRSLSYCGREGIADMIRKAYNKGKKAWKIAALESMGRSADTCWKDLVLENLTSPDADFQYEAIRAAGELELKSARPTLLRLLAEESDNNDVFYQAIWALSKIGGEAVRETLQDLYDNADDDEEIEVLEMALDNLDFTEENSNLSIF
jgi:hypothetical protein